MLLVLQEPMATHAEAQDVAQEAFIKAYRAIGNFRGDSAFFTWMYRIARNNALNAIRSRKDFIQNEDLSVYSNVGEDGNKEIDTFQLNGRLRSLEEHHQRAIELVYFNGLTHREAHEEMGVPLGTFKSYVQQALRQLRTLYKDELFLFLSISRTLNHG